MENLTKEQEWISVKDQLPELKKKVLIYVSSDNEKLTGLHVGHRMPGNDFWIISGKFSFDVGDVTHWTVLPNLPASDSVAAPKEHIYTDKEIIGLAEKEIESLRQQLKERDELIVNLKQDIVRLIEDVNKAYDH